MKKLTLMQTVLWLAYPGLAAEGVKADEVLRVVGKDCGRLTVQNLRTLRTINVFTTAKPGECRKLVVTSLLNVGNRKHARTGEDYGEEVFDADGDSMGFTVPSGMAKKPYRRRYLNLDILGARDIVGMEALA